MSGTSLIDPLKLRVCDDNYNPSVIVNLYNALSYTERFANRDSFAFEIQRSAKNAEYLEVGKILLVPKDSTHETMRVLIIKQIEVNESTITVSGNDYIWDLLTARIVLDGTATGTGYDTQEGVAETVARHYIETNLTAAVNTSRRDELVYLEAAHDTPVGGNVKIEGRFQTLQEIMESICTQGQIGIEGVLVETTDVDWGWLIEIRISSGVDRSQTYDD